MTENEAKKKECPHHLLSMLTLQIASKRDGATIAQLKEIEAIGLCTASDCAMWDSEYEEESMNISEKEKTPEGWHVKRDGVKCNKHKYVGVIGKARLVFRYTKIASGDCGLKTKESGCFYPG